MKIHSNDEKSNIAGFTLIELALVIMIIGIMFIPLLNLYGTYYKDQMLTKTRTNVTYAASLIGSAWSKRYPCPADPTLGPNDPQYGLEQIDAGGNCKVIAGKIISVPGARTAGHTVLIGAVPIRSISNQIATIGEMYYIPDYTSLDAWGNKLLYAVTLSQTVYPAPLEDGQIRAIDENTNPTAGIKDDAHFVVLSHGPNGNGAYSRDGALVSPCVATTKEGENCNANSTFMSSLGFYEGGGTNPSYFDDTVYFVKSSNIQLWDSVTPGSDNIYNTNTGNVGVKTGTPTEKLDVNGKLKVTNNAKVAQICDYNGNNCFNVKSITTTGMACPTNQVMLGISKGAPICGPVVMAPPIDKDCGTGKWITGIQSDGTVTCTP